MRAPPIAALCLVALGCGADREAAHDAARPAPAPVPVVTEAPVPQPPPPPEPTVVLQSQAYAVFVGDELDRCLEHTRRYTIPFGTEWSPRAMPPMEPVPEGRVIALTTDCATAFEGRTVLASCDGSTDLVDGALPTGVTVMETFSTQSFRFETSLADDARLAECLAAQRRWTAVSDSSVEFARARTAMRERERARTR
jgi:hypothetical protein